MGNLLSLHKCEQIENPKKINLLRKLNTILIPKMEVKPIECSTTFGSVIDNFKQSHPQDVVDFFQNAIQDDTSLITEAWVTENHIKTGNTHVTIKIMETAEQEPMLRNVAEKNGKALQLTLVTKEKYSDDIFNNGNWFGSWYNDGKLSAHISYKKEIGKC